MTDTQKPIEDPHNFAKKLNDLLEKRGIKDQTCPTCGEKNSYTLLERYFIANISDSGDPKNALPKGSMPFMTLVCMKCGNTQFLNSLVLGAGNNFFEVESKDDDTK